MSSREVNYDEPLFVQRNTKWIMTNSWQNWPIWHFDAWQRQFTVEMTCSLKLVIQLLEKTRNSSPFLTCRWWRSSQDTRPVFLEQTVGVTFPHHLPPVRTLSWPCCLSKADFRFWRFYISQGKLLYFPWYFCWIKSNKLASCNLIFVLQIIVFVR